jgi:hypothetical protein
MPNKLKLLLPKLNAEQNFEDISFDEHSQTMWIPGSAKPITNTTLSYSQDCNSRYKNTHISFVIINDSTVSTVTITCTTDASNNLKHMRVKNDAVVYFDDIKKIISSPRFNGCRANIVFSKNPLHT